MSIAKSQAHPDSELLRMDQAARVLNVGRSTIYTLAQSGQLPGVIRVGRSLRVSRRRLLEWIEDNASAPAAS